MGVLGSLGLAPGYYNSIFLPTDAASRGRRAWDQASLFTPPHDDEFESDFRHPRLRNIDSIVVHNLNPCVWDGIPRGRRRMHLLHCTATMHQPAHMLQSLMCPQHQVAHTCGWCSQECGTCIIVAFSVADPKLWLVKGQSEAQRRGCRACEMPTNCLVG